MRKLIVNCEFFMKVRIICIILIISILASKKAYSQLTQTIKGYVIDNESNSPLPGANIIVVDSNPAQGTTTNNDGSFKLEGVKVGRVNLKISFIGYNELIIPQVLVSSGKEVILTIELSENITTLKEVVINASESRNEALNTMSTISNRSISVEQTKRFAGGLDDPSRLVSSFAGVSTEGNFESNAIMIRGNSPTGVLWQIEGVEVPTPSHFSNAEILGGGSITLFSNSMLATSDFFTGAFPAEYVNATSGVFDIKLRTGNNEKFEHSFQVGLLGLDFSSEGPISRSSKSSYLFNYRYSTMGIVEQFLPDEGLPTYQDLCFKLNFPTKKAGTFSLWGIGGISHYKASTVDARFKTGTTSLQHKLPLNSHVYINSSITTSYNFQKTIETKNPTKLESLPWVVYNFREDRYSFKSVINSKLNKKHSNRTGITATNICYKYNISNTSKGYFDKATQQNGSTWCVSGFSQSKIKISDKFSATIGLNSIYFVLNKKLSVAPRAGVNFEINARNKLGIAYGKHNQTQFLNVYFIERQQDNKKVYPNKNLDLTTSQHYIFCYEFVVNNSTNIKIEPYYQILSKMPVIENSPIALINIPHFHHFNEVLTSKGTGKNYGIDFTFEKSLKQGFYYLITASLFQSKYKTNDGIERNTAYNNKYVINLLSGKEWELSENKNIMVGISGRLYFKGGNPVSPVDEIASKQRQEIVTDESRAFEETYPGLYRFDFNVYLRKNISKYSTIISFQANNLFFSPTFYERKFDFSKNEVKEVIDGSVFPNISWKIEF